MAQTVVEYFNGGKRPLWLNDCERGGDNWLLTPLGGRVTVIGPMILPPNDNGRLQWMSDDRPAAAATRKALADFLEYGS